MSRALPVERHGRGAVSTRRASERRIRATRRSRELAREVATTLGCTTWSAVGPGGRIADGRLGARRAGKTARWIHDIGSRALARQRLEDTRAVMTASVSLNTSFFSAENTDAWTRAFATTPSVCPALGANRRSGNAW